MSDERREQLGRWLAGVMNPAPVDLQPASGDASFRRYFRVTTTGASRIAMDAPPPEEDCRPFVRIAAMLADMGLNAPRVLASDFDAGFLLLTDLGDRQYLDVLRGEPHRAPRLYRDALQALAILQHKGRNYQSKLPPYDASLLARELQLFRDWLCGTHLELEFSAADEHAWQRTCDVLIEAALAQPRVFVHRDYHSRNLTPCDGANPGILDFQDAVEGPLTYDLVSLLKDCYIRWSPEQTRSRAVGFFRLRHEALPAALDRAAFLRAFDLMGVQRHLKAAGIFARLSHRDGKDGYLADVPRTLRYVTAVAGEFPELAFLGRLLDDRCLPRLEAAA
ncbi:MAG: phosphotransferase [Woeseiaceae bacterium]|nr:phosphotransferase [Woeseiaceae bacterium]